MGPAHAATPGGDVVLCNLPPYNTQPWLSMGVVLHYALLAQAGIRARVVRPLAPPYDVPRGVAHASDITFLLDPSMDERMAAMEREHRAEPAFFDALVDALLDGPERIVGLSLFRNNADVSLFVARLLKQRRPDAIVVLGGPEVIEDPEAMTLPWIDVVVGADAESILVPLMERMLRGRASDVASLRNVWVHRDLGHSPMPPALRMALPTPPMPRIEFAPLVPLLVGDPIPTMPLLLNWGCPYHCAFCSNRNVYSRFTPGDVGRVLDEFDEILGTWADLHRGEHASTFILQLSDATTNVIPAQFDTLLNGIVERQRSWGEPPLVRGQTLVDHRMTEARARRMVDANFASTFFGLESGSDELRRALGKPGSIAQVRAGMEAYRRGGLRGLHFGVPVGIPGETEAHFRETEQFIEWSLTLGDTIQSITVLPYSFFLSAQDPELQKMNRGARRGLLWRTDGPAGEPAERARRTMRLFDRLEGRAECVSPFPPYIALPAMLPDEDPAILDAWMKRHGRQFDQLASRHDGDVASREREDGGRPHSVDVTPPVGGAWAYVDAVFQQATPAGGWALESFAWMRGSTGARVVLFRRAKSGQRFALLLEPHDPARPSFARSRDFNISYMKDWEGAACAFDHALMTFCVRTLERAAAPAVSP